jgi:hypothetical protein
MTRKTIIALRTEADALLPDNTTGEISPADVRGVIKDIIDTFSPGYGILATETLTMAALGLTPRAIPYTETLALTPEYTAVLGTGAVTRLAQGLPTTVNRISFSADVAAPTGDEIVVSLFRDGIDIPGGTTCSGQGIGNFVQAAFSIGTTSPGAADHVYDVRASKISGGADDVQFANVRFILEVVPTIGI